MRTVRGYGEVQKAAEELLSTLTPLAHARVVVLSGDLGSGKTTFVQALARNLGVIETVTSPTFIIERVYKLEREGRRFDRLIHIDAYRLEAEKELEALGWREIAANAKNLIVIEWGERVRSLLPHDAMFLTFSYVDSDTRTISYVQ